ncbi:hypothetical protein LINPERPRIM_LOCUS34259 [Linum perenne]
MFFPLAILRTKQYM